MEYVDYNKGFKNILIKINESSVFDVVGLTGLTALFVTGPKKTSFLSLILETKVNKRISEAGEIRASTQPKSHFDGVQI